MTPFLVVPAAIGLFIGFVSPRFNGKLTIGMILTLGFAFFNLMLLSARTTGIDMMNTVVPPLATIGAFLAGLGARALVNAIGASFRW
jgi:hypothetical protein